MNEPFETMYPMAFLLAEEARSKKHHGWLLLSVSERTYQVLFYLLAFISLCNSWAVMATHPQTGRVVLATNEPGTSLIFLPGDPAGYTVELVMPLPDALFLN